jgi:hypothetical protein
MAMKKPKTRKAHGRSLSPFQKRLKERVAKDKEILEALD